MNVLHYYSRKGCHLCEVMLEELLPLLRGKVEVEVHDIDSRVEWREKYGSRIPVVEYEGQWVCDYPLDDGAIRSILTRMSGNSE